MNTIESISPILSVADMQRSLAFYVNLLGFENADWGDDHFTGVSRDGSTILLRKDVNPVPSRIYLQLMMLVQFTTILRQRKSQSCRDRRTRDMRWKRPSKIPTGTSCELVQNQRSRTCNPESV